MDVLTDAEIRKINSKSKLIRKYSEEIDRESAYEILAKKIEEANQQAEAQAQEETKQESNEPSTAAVIGKSVVKVVTSATFIRGVFGVLSKKETLKNQLYSIFKRSKAL